MAADANTQQTFGYLHAGAPTYRLDQDVQILATLVSHYNTTQHALLAERLERLIERVCTRIENAL